MSIFLKLFINMLTVIPFNINISLGGQFYCIVEPFQFCIIYESIYASVNQVSIGSDNGLSPIQCLAII